MEILTCSVRSLQNRLHNRMFQWQKELFYRMEKKSSQIIRENITYMINSDETTSMRNLSTSIGASDSFIQKILTEKANPSLDKIDLISEYFDVESWEMLYNFRKDNDDMLHILQMLQKLPASSMPVVKEFLTFLLKQFPDSSEH